MIEKAGTKSFVTKEKLIHDLINRVETIIAEADKKIQAIETEPHRSNLFEVFAMADGAGLLTEDEPNLDADKLVAVLAERWGLKQQAQAVMTNRAAELGKENLNRMRLLLSTIRMWQEWSYAWSRWTEFHEAKRTMSPSQPAESYFDEEPKPDRRDEPGFEDE